MRLLSIVLSFLLIVSTPLHSAESYTYQYQARNMSSSELQYLLKAFHPEIRQITAFTDNRLELRVDEQQLNTLPDILQKMDRDTLPVTVKIFTGQNPLDAGMIASLNLANASDKPYKQLTVQEDQWATIATNLSIPYTVRQRNEDGSESVKQDHKSYSENIDFKIRTYQNQCLIFIGEQSVNQQENASGYTIRTVIKTTNDRWVWVNNRPDKAAVNPAMPPVYTYLNIAIHQ